MTQELTLPEDLQSIDAFAQSIEEQFNGLGNVEKGDRFFNLGVGLTFSAIRPFEEYLHPIKSSKRSHDHGVDFTASSKDYHKKLYGQSKYTISDKDDLDEIFSDFSRIESAGDREAAVDGRVPLNFQTETNVFVIITASYIENIIKKYEGAKFPSYLTFYKNAKAESRLIIVQRHDLFEAAKKLFQRQFLPPDVIDLSSPAGFIHHQNVYHGIVQAQLLKKLYSQYGDSLFFENIRDFIGIEESEKGRESVNDEIKKTLENEPEKMLERNNGITFRGEKVTPIGNDRSGNKILRIHHGGIINGCQTTMCSVVAERLPDEAYVSVKIVEAKDAEESWSVARSTNWQNSIPRIDLDLAPFLRPQYLKLLAARQGIAIVPQKEQEASFTNIVGQMYRVKSNIPLIQSLVIGLFLKSSPQAMFRPSYESIDIDMLDSFKRDADKRDMLFGTLFELSGKINESIDRVMTTIDEASRRQFQRFFSQDKANYRCYLALVACFASFDLDITDKYNDKNAWIVQFLSHIRSSISSKADENIKFENIFQLTVNAVMLTILANQGQSSDEELAARLSTLIQSQKQLPFVKLVQMARLNIQTFKR